MSVKRVILLIATAYILGYIAHAFVVGKTVYGDGRYYFAWMHTLARDRDLNFANEYRQMSIGEHLAPTGLPVNKYSIGPGVFWIPPYLSLQSVMPGNWLSFPYQVFIGLTSVFAAISGLILMLRYLPGSGRISAVTLLLIAGATNLAFYGSVDSVNSHAISFFYASVLVAFLAMPRPHSAASGFMLGLLSTVRFQDVVFALLFIPVRRKISWPMVILGFAVAFVPQVAVWYAMYGSVTNPYLAGGERFGLLSMNIPGVLFAPQSGLFLWTPVVAVGLYGLFTEWKKYWAYIAVFLAELIIVASWSTWWQGASYSGRMFVSTLPFVAVGLSRVVSSISKRPSHRNSLPILALSLCFLNVMLILFYLTMH